MIQLKFLGRGAAFYPAYGNTNAYFDQDGDLFFLDFGEAAFDKAVRSIDFGAYRNIYALITHLHADHAGSLASLLSYTSIVLNRTVNVIHPLDTVNQMLRLQGIARTFYHYAPVLPEKCPIRAQAVEVPHAKDMQAFGYILRGEGDAVYFSGDAAKVPDSVLKAFLNGEIRLLYQDTAGHESASHCWYKSLEAEIQQEHRKRVFCMHLDGPYEAVLQQLGFSVVQAME
ncbi:hypothetical protein SDC9_154148 [bioreactor metagenome]|uniref:Metallo-beta-lactamase domain-containing protein n=1 Tax=bioreactor metagenome TaxID=1076179 RepID=A0A645EXZ7_9ZZZZ